MNGMNGMVYLNRIYTKTGDGGETSLGDGARVPKTSRRIQAFGGVDELNSVIGVALTHAEPDSPMIPQLRAIQNDLFDLGADLCVPEVEARGTENAVNPLRILPEQVARLEREIDAAVNELSPLTSFILPGGSRLAAHLHLARTVCRRVEIGVLELAEHEPINSQALIYLNRLSDLLFVLARVANDHGQSDILWIPGKERKRSAE